MKMIKVAVLAKWVEKNGADPDMVAYRVSELVEALEYENFNVTIYYDIKELHFDAMRSCFSQVYIMDIDRLGLPAIPKRDLVRRLDSDGVRVIALRNGVDTLDEVSRRGYRLWSIQFPKERRLEYLMYQDREAEAMQGRNGESGFKFE